MSRVRSSSLLSVCLTIAALAAASTALALEVESASIAVRKRGEETLRLKGRFADLSFEAAHDVVLTLGELALQLPVADFTRRKHTLSYRRPAGPARVSRMRIDLRRRRFMATATGWALARRTSPIAIGIGADAASDCRMIRLRTRGRKGTRLSLAGDDGGPCGAIGVPRLMPVVVRPGVPAAVRFEVRSVADAGSLQLFRADASGQAAGDALCTFTPAPEGGPNANACTATIAEANPTLVRLVITGRVQGGPAVSPGFTLPVAAEPTDADLAGVVAAGAEAGRIWTEQRARLGDGLPARMETLRALASVPGILDAAPSPNGIDVGYRYTTGWLGLLLLNRAPDDAAVTGAARGTREAVREASPTSRDVAVAARGQTTHPSQARGATPARPVPRGVFRSCGGADICCGAGGREPLLGRSMLIWDPGFFGTSQDDATVVERRVAAQACLGFSAPREISGADADVASLAALTTADTVIVSSHAGVDRHDRVAIATGEPVNVETLRNEQFLLDAGLVLDGTPPDFHAVVPLHVFLASEDYLRALPGRFPERSIVYVSTCFSSYGGMTPTFLGKGAGAYFGYDWSVYTTFTLGVAGQLFDGLLPKYRTARAAFDAVNPKLDPFPQVGHVPDPSGPGWLAAQRPAEFLLDGNGAIAYTGPPEVSPDLSQLGPGEQATLTAEVEGRGTCELRYHWHNTAEHGHLSGDGGSDDFVGSDATATYTADPTPRDGTDDVAVEVLAPDEDEALGPSCAAAAVSETTTTTTASSTTTTTLACTAGLLASAEVETRINLGAQAIHVDPTGPDEVQQDPFVRPRTTVTLGPGGGAEQVPWNLSATAGGATATSSGSVGYLVSPCALTAHGTFHEASSGGSEDETATTTLEVSLQIKFRVSEMTPYTLAGFVQASGTPTSRGPTEYIRCSSHFGIAEASLQAPSGVPTTFERHSGLHPSEEGLITCGVIRGGGSGPGGGSDSADLAWSFTWQLGQ